MRTLRLLAMLAIAVGGTPAVVLAEQPPSAGLRELDGAAFAEGAPQTRSATVAPVVGCPYRFDSDMPAATFCVYRGVALGGRGEVCATDVVAIWSSSASQAAVGVKHATDASVSRREIYLAFVAHPELVLRAIVDSRRGDRAEMIGYTLGNEGASQPLGGRMTLRAVRLGSADVFNMDLREPRSFHPGSCAFVSYTGTFLGVMQPPSESTISFDPFIVPRK
jgi:hypothetical protein